MINIVVPLLGKGQRFQEAGYHSSKPLIMSSGKEMIFWLLDCLVDKDANVFVIYRSELDDERFPEKIDSRYGKRVNLKSVSYDTEGAAHTLLIALDEMSVDMSLPLIVCDADTFYDKEHIHDIKNVGNCIFYFIDDGIDPIYSYLKIVDEKVTSIEEKNKVSDYASVGTYCFDSGTLAKKYCKKIIKKNLKKKGEYYISSVFQEMIDDGIKVTSRKVRNFNCIGTPSQLQASKIKNVLRICFDLDSTLVTEPRSKGDYSTVEPIQKNIEFLRYLRQQGHEIIIHTARGMKSHFGNVGKLTTNIGKITFETLDKYGIPYDEIYFGKPYADLYIDDKAINAYSDLEKSTGIYRHALITRQHNDVRILEQVVKKSSKNQSIKGEAHWYANIPAGLQHLFPKLLSQESFDDFTELTLEKVEGTTLSKLLITGAFQKSDLTSLMDGLRLIHESSILVDREKINIYSNYASKLTSRFKTFDASIVSEKTIKLFEGMNAFLVSYEKQKKAVTTNIHGDPVFTNVFLDTNGRIKFIDMRGLQGEVPTLVGDRNYDYAKVYQSLLGYDYIVHNQRIDDEVLRNLRSEFFELVDCDETEIQKLSSILLFTCIPLQPRVLWDKLLNLSYESFYEKFTKL